MKHLPTFMQRQWACTRAERGLTVCLPSPLPRLPLGWGEEMAVQRLMLRGRIVWRAHLHMLQHLSQLCVFVCVPVFSSTLCPERKQSDPFIYQLLSGSKLRIRCPGHA